MIVCSKDHCKQSSQQLAERARKILQAEIDFIPNPSFQDSDADEVILGQPLPESNTEITAAAFTKPGSRALSTQIARLCRSEVLSAADEQDLFRRMNYLKFKANMHRCKLDPEEVESCELERIENLLQQAEQVRDQIFRSNMRLVVSIVKKCVTPGVSFDELLSDGCLTLMHAIEKFDYARGSVSVRTHTTPFRITRTAKLPIAARNATNSNSWVKNAPWKNCRSRRIR